MKWEECHVKIGVWSGASPETRAWGCNCKENRSAYRSLVKWNLAGCGHGFSHRTPFMRIQKTAIPTHYKEISTSLVRHVCSKNPFGIYLPKGFFKNSVSVYAPCESLHHIIRRCVFGKAIQQCPSHRVDDINLNSTIQSFLVSHRQFSRPKIAFEIWF